MRRPQHETTSFCHHPAPYESLWVEKYDGGAPARAECGCCCCCCCCCRMLKGPGTRGGPARADCGCLLGLLLLVGPFVVGLASLVRPPSAGGGGIEGITGP